MRGRVGSLLVRELASLYGVRRTYHISSNSATSFLLKSTVINTPARSLYSISWNGPFYNESRAWSPFIQHMSTAAAQVAGGSEITPSGKPSASEEPANATTAKPPSKEERFGKPKEVSSYWGVAPKVQHKDDGTPWRWACFTVSRPLPLPR